MIYSFKERAELQTFKDLESKKKVKTFIRKFKAGELIKSTGPIALKINGINSHGQVEITFVMEQDVFMERP